MTRIPSHTIGDAPEVTRPLLEEMMQFSPNGRLLAMHAQMAHAPAVLDAYVNIRRATSRHGTLDLSLRSALMLASAAVEGNEYALAIVTMLALRSGWRRDQVDALRAGEGVGEEKADALIAVVREGTANHGRVRDATWEQAISSGWTDADGNLVNVFSSGCGLACLLDPGRDRCADLHRAADRAQPVMRLHHHVRQDRTGRIALLPAGKHDPVRHLDVGEVVAVGVPDLVRAREHLERFRLSPARRQDVDIDGRAPADRGEQQFGGGEVFAAGAKRDLAAPDVGGGEPAVRGALDGYVAVLRTSRHGHSLSDAYPRADWRPGGRAAED
jgi:alkylhydroperoxidase/carboxymuconolactone decarboxylase family protein YurZ